MASNFSLRDYIAAGSVPELGTKQEQIEYIDIDLLMSDERNFYELSGIPELSASIELIGLQQPIRVRVKGDAYVIVSGHRRKAALRHLVLDGREDLRLVPCIVESGQVSEAMQELRLIYANSDTRKLTNAEIAKQADRIKSLLYQLKEEGVEFPGRMRDHVAEACQISKSKLARLEVIQKKLISNLRPGWERGMLPEANAYRIAQEPDHIQAKLMARHGTDLYKWTEAQISRAVDRARLESLRNEPQMNAVSARIQAQNYLQELDAENARFLDAMREHGYDILSRYLQGKPSRREGIEALKKGPGFSHRGGGHSTLDYQCMPQYFAICVRPEPEIKRSWTEVWDAMAVVALERAAVPDDEDEAEDEATPPSGDEWATWACGEYELPAESGFYLCLTGPMKGGGKLFWWNNDMGRWEHPGASVALMPDVQAWVKAPEIPESLSWNREVYDDRK